MVELGPRNEGNRFLYQIGVKVHRISASIRGHKLTRRGMFFINFMLSDSVFRSLGPRWIRRSHAIKGVSRRPTLAAFSRRFGARGPSTRLCMERITICLVSMVRAATIRVLM